MVAFQIWQRSLTWHDLAALLVNGLLPTPDLAPPLSFNVIINDITSKLSCHRYAYTSTAIRGGYGDLSLVSQDLILTTEIMAAITDLTLLQNADSTMEFPRPFLQNGCGKYGKNIERNKVFKNHRRSRNFHDDFKKRLWKLQASTIVLGNYHGSVVVPQWFIKNDHGIFDLYDRFLKTIVQKSWKIQTKR